MSKLQSYHRDFKEFLSISSATLTPETAKRVAQARNKLLKLTPSQFYDLSTDVYDELQRRISESDQTEEFLSPNHQYHPKRNQARQKLAILPSTRFNDLVNDVLFEMERREPMDSPVTDQYQLKTPVNSHFDHSISSPPETPSQREIKSSTVVPKKSELSWSSDEEDDQHAPSEVAVAAAEKASLLSKKSTSNDYNNFSPQKSVKSTNSKTSNTGSHLNGVSGKSHQYNRSIGSMSQARLSNKENDAQTLMEECAKMDSEITSLNKRLASKNAEIENLEFNLDSLSKDNEVLKKKIQENETVIAELKDVKLQHQELQREFESQQSEHARLQGVIDEHTLQTKEISDKHDQLKNDYDFLKEQHESAVASHGETKKQLIQQMEKLRSDSSSKALTSDELKNLPEYAILKNQYNSLESDHENLLVSHADISKELNLLKAAKVGNISAYSSLTNLSGIDNSNNTKKSDELKTIKSLRDQVKEWQSKFELARTGQIASELKQSFSKDELTKFIDPSGSVPLSLIAAFYSATESMLIYVNSNEIDSNILFERGASVATSANDISTCVKMQNSGSIFEKADFIKSSVQSFLTNLRHYSVYNGLSPKILIEMPITSLYFAVCDFVSLVKIQEGDALISSTSSSGSRALDFGQSEKDNSSPVQEISTPRNLKIDTTTSPIVRPLKMAQKLNSPNESSAGDRNKPKPLGSTFDKSSPMRTLSPIQISTVASKDIHNGSVKTPTSLSATPLKQSNDFATPNMESPKSPIRATPSPSNSISERMKQLQMASNGDASPPSKNNTPVKGLNAASAFDKFGAKRRDNSIDSGRELKSSPVNKKSEPTAIPTTIVKDEISNPMLDDEEDEEEEDFANAPPSSGRTIPSAGSALDFERNGQASHNNDEEEVYEEDFDFENFNILDPDNTLKELLSYLEHQTQEVIHAIQSLLESIRDPKATRALLRGGASEIIDVVNQMTQGTSTLMEQARYQDLMGHARYVVATLSDCAVRFENLYNQHPVDQDHEYAEKSFKQRSAGIAFDVAKSTKELVKAIEEASLKDEIAVYNDRLKN